MLTLKHERRNRLRLTAVVNGFGPFAFMIDNGAQPSLGNLAPRKRIWAKRAQEVTSTDVNGVDIVGQLGLLRPLTIAGLSFTDVARTMREASQSSRYRSRSKPPSLRDGQRAPT